MLSRASDRSHDEFVEYWEESHAPIASELPNLERYAIAPATNPEDAPHDGVAELVFKTEADLYEALDSDQFDRVREDAAEFSDPDAVEFMILKERVQHDESA